MISHVILPLFLFIVLGWVLKRIGLFGPEVSQGLTQYVFYIAIPVLILHLIAQQSLSAFLLGDFTLLALGMYLAPFLLVYLMSRRHGHGVAVIKSWNVGLVNSALIGIPILIGLVGPKAVAPAALINIICCLVITPLGILLIERHNQDAQHWHHCLKPLIKNPVIIAITIGLVISGTKFPIPALINRFFDLIDATAAPLALLVIGMDIDFRLLRKKWRAIISLSLLRMLVVPIIVMIIVHWLPWPNYLRYAAVLGAALPTAKGTYIYSSIYQHYQKETAANIVLTTLLAMLTLPTLMAIAMWLWP